MTASLDLVALICSKLCHDLAGSIGAVNNGAELLAEETDPVMRDEAIRLVAQSAQDAARRLSFYRLALGASGSLEDAMPVSEFARVAGDYFSGGRVTLQLPAWTGMPQDLPKALGKALLLGLWSMNAALPRGGTLALESAGSESWRILAAGGPIKIPEAIAAAFDAAAGAAADPHTALARHAAELAAAAGFAARLEASAEQALLSFSR